ncbi:hypothetical protein FB451DRAFT_1162792 [Mycena latifolia]|nr:hypothetical protein FB451DRAFT_1162792 [Mycena latifolia]
MSRRIDRSSSSCRSRRSVEWPWRRWWRGLWGHEMGLACHGTVAVGQYMIWVQLVWTHWRGEEGASCNNNAQAERNHGNGEGRERERRGTNEGEANRVGELLKDRIYTKTEAVRGSRGGLIVHMKAVSGGGIWKRVSTSEARMVRGAAQRGGGKKQGACGLVWFGGPGSAPSGTRGLVNPHPEKHNRRRGDYCRDFVDLVASER